MAIVSSSATGRANQPQQRKGMRWGDLREHLTGYLFVFPSILLVFIFGVFPIAYAFYMSLRRWRVRDGGFIGLRNYEKALGDWTGALIFLLGFVVLIAAYYLWTYLTESQGRGGVSAWVPTILVLVAAGVAISNGWNRMLAAGDEDYLASIPITFYYAIGAVPLQLAISLTLAFILYQKIRGQEFFRMIFFLPYITPAIATALVFRFIFSPRPSSLANYVLEKLSLEPQKWLFEPGRLINVVFGSTFDGFFAGPSMALWTITLFGIWTFVGYNVVIYLAGLGNIPPSLYEAAEIDGATQSELFWHITVPLLSPVTFYLSLIGFIGTFKAFNHIFVMQEPSAQGTVETASVAIFNTFYKANQFGYATAQAMLLFVIIMFLTFVQTKVLGDKVFYG